MSASSSRAPPKPAPWKKQFLEHVNKMASPEFVLSTLAAATPGSPTSYLPRARYCIFRGLWAELPENELNKAERNPRVYESELPTFTTDVRMEKVGHLFGSGAGNAENYDQIQGSGGGGPVEAVWWIKEDSIMTQWRVKGTAFIIAPDIDSGTHSGVRTIKSEIGSRMRVVDESKKDEWSWKREVDGHFGNVSPTMRGSWKQPPPGMPASFNPDNLKLGEKVDDLNDPLARKNFRVVIIKPDSVESMDLSDPSKARRQRYSYDETSGEWKHEETWP